MVNNSFAAYGVFSHKIASKLVSKKTPYVSNVSYYEIYRFYTDVFRCEKIKTFFRNQKGLEKIKKIPK